MFFINNIIHPDSPKKIIWNTFIAFIVLCTIILAPLTIALNIEYTLFFILTDIIITTLFTVDIFLNLHTAYYEGRQLITDPKKIRKRYMKTWFYFDLLAAFPFFLLPGITGAFHHFIRFLRLVRVLKVFTLFQAINRIKKQKVSSNFIRIVIMIFWLLLTAHIIACGFIMVGGISRELSHSMQYIQAIYWTMTTLATVGYGDITPDKTSELQLIYTVIAQIIGVGMYGYVIGSISNVISNIDIAKSHFMERMEKINTFLSYRNISADVVNKVNNYYYYLWDTRRGYEESDILDGLPKNIKLRIAEEIHSDILRKVPLFRDSGTSFIQDIILDLEPLVFTPGDIIIEKGDIGYEMFFINRGIVDVIGDDGKTVVVSLNEGAFFGEIALLLRTPRTATIIAKEYCDLYALHKRKFDIILTRHPDVAVKMKELSELRQKEMNSTK